MQQEPNCLEIVELNILALWILRVCYGQEHPSPKEIIQVENELRQIQAYENYSEIA